MSAISTKFADCSTLAFPAKEMVIHGSGQIVNMEQQPELFNRTVLDFLARLPPK
jgi:hypothetical protein